MHATGVSGGKGPYERKPKASHRDTVSYEIEMLTFCVDRLRAMEGQEQTHKDLCIEGFLLHYRNLIRFFSGKLCRNGDLSTAAPLVWAGRELNAEEVKAIKAPALVLDSRYFDEISVYLQHCTIHRYERSKTWDVTGMKNELDPILAEFEGAFPR